MTGLLDRHTIQVGISSLGSSSSDAPVNISSMAVFSSVVRGESDEDEERDPMEDETEEQEGGNPCCLASWNCFNSAIDVVTPLIVIRSLPSDPDVLS